MLELLTWRAFFGSIEEIRMITNLSKLHKNIQKPDSFGTTQLVEFVSIFLQYFDIPLLFETGGDKSMDAVACVSVSPEIQEKRVLERGTMDKSQFELIRNKQYPDAEKRARSDFVIITDSLEHARKQVKTIVAEIRAGSKHA